MSTTTKIIEIFTEKQNAPPNTPIFSEFGDQTVEMESPTVPLLSESDSECSSDNNGNICCPPCPTCSPCQTIFENVCLGVGAFALLVGMSSMFMNCIKKDEKNNNDEKTGSNVDVNVDIENQANCL